MDIPNYASAAPPPPPLPSTPPPIPYVWRSGKMLVIRKGAALPDRCVKTNQPAAGIRVKQTLYWHSSIIYLLIFINLFIFVLVALFVREKAKVELPLSPERFARRKRLRRASIMVSLAGTAMTAAGLAVFDSFPALAIIGVLTASVGLFFYALWSPILRTVKIDRTLIWLKGAHADFLATLPELPPI